MKINGLNKLVRELRTVQSALAELDGEIGRVSFDPNNPGSIDLAIRSMEQMIDARTAQLGGSDIVDSLVGETKESFRRAILERAASARLESDDE